MTSNSRTTASVAPAQTFTSFLWAIACNGWSISSPIDPSTLISNFCQIRTPHQCTDPCNHESAALIHHYGHLLCARPGHSVKLSNVCYITSTIQRPRISAQLPSLRHSGFRNYVNLSWESWQCDSDTLRVLLESLDLNKQTFMCPIRSLHWIHICQARSVPASAVPSSLAWDPKFYFRLNYKRKDLSPRSGYQSSAATSIKLRYPMRLYTSEGLSIKDNTSEWAHFVSRGTNFLIRFTRDQSFRVLSECTCCPRLPSRCEESLVPD